MADSDLDWEFLYLQRMGLLLQTQILEINTKNEYENRMTGKLLREILEELKKFNSRIDKK